MQVAFSSVNCALNSKPSRAKKPTDASMLLTGRFTKIVRAGAAGTATSSGVRVGVRGCRHRGAGELIGHGAVSFDPPRRLPRVSLIVSGAGDVPSGGVAPR